MKRALALLLLSLMFATFLTGCKSQEEKDLESAREAARELQQQYENQKRKYDSLKKDIDDYNQSLDRLESAR